jgi:hypothetical protein
LKAEVSKVDYASKAKSSNVRGAITFFFTFLNLGQLSPHKFKNLYSHFTIHYCMGRFEISFRIKVKFLYKFAQQIVTFYELFIEENRSNCGQATCTTATRRVKCEAALVVGPETGADCNCQIPDSRFGSFESSRDKGRMLWPRLNEKDQGLRIHACNTLPVTYRNFTELSTASVSQRR